MSISLTDDQWDFVDEMVRLDRTLPAIQFVHQSTPCHLKDAIEAVHSRKQKLGIDFSSNTSARLDALTRLDKITDPICVIEGSWDGDDSGWFIRLEAIVEKPSQQHPRYTQYGLCDIRGMDAPAEQATALGEELARTAHTTFYLTDEGTNFATLDYEKRWWDTH